MLVTQTAPQGLLVPVIGMIGGVSGTAAAAPGGGGGGGPTHADDPTNTVDDPVHPIDPGP